MSTAPVQASVAPADLLRRVRRIQIYTSRLVSDVLAGQYHSAFKGRGVEFEEVREYQPGDDVRAIDWNVTARAGRPFVKSFREERELTVLLLVDISASQDFGTRDAVKSERVAELGATLAFSAILNNDKVGLLLFSDRVERVVPPRKGKRHVLRCVRELLLHRRAGRTTDIAAALEYVQQTQTRRAVVFLISDFHAGPFTTPLRSVARRHDLVPVRLLDERELRWPRVGRVELLDMETGERVVANTSSRSFQRRFLEQGRQRSEALTQELRRLGLDLIDIAPGEPLAPPLLRYFRQRGGRR